MELNASMSEIVPIIKEVLQSGGVFTLAPRGVSMTPLIVEGRDSVVLASADDDLKSGDIVLYQRTNGAYVLHRIVAVDGEIYTICGDNQFTFEKNITRSQIIAVATHLNRKGKKLDLRNGTRLYKATLPMLRFFNKYIRFNYRRLRRFAARVVKGRG